MILMIIQEYLINYIFTVGGAKHEYSWSKGLKKTSKMDLKMDLKKLMYLYTFVAQHPVGRWVHLINHQPTLP